MIRPRSLVKNETSMNLDLFSISVSVPLLNLLHKYINPVIGQTI